MKYDLMTLRLATSSFGHQRGSMLHHMEMGPAQHSDGVGERSLGGKGKMKE